MFKIKLTARAYKELKLLSKNRQLAIKQIVEELKENPFSGKPLLRELTGRFSYRVGVHRVIYKVNKKDKIIYILTVGHRSAVYS